MTFFVVKKNQKTDAILMMMEAVVGGCFSYN
jgi:hypothetical protein